MTVKRYGKTLGLGSVATMVLLSMAMGCARDHDAHVDIVDVHGYHHQGYYDEHHDWHGGYYDEGHAFHDDPHDWHQ